MEKFIISNGCALRITDTLKGEKVVMLLHGYLESLDVCVSFESCLFCSAIVDGFHDPIVLLSC